MTLKWGALGNVGVLRPARDADEMPSHVKFTQVSIAGVANTERTQCDYVIAAVDDKGRIWECLRGQWYCVPSPKPK